MILQIPIPKSRTKLFQRKKCNNTFHFGNKVRGKKSADKIFNPVQSHLQLKKNTL